MPRLTASRRLGIMSAAIAIVEDRGQAVALEEIAEQVGESVEDVRESVGPLPWIEFRTPEGVVDRVEWISLEDDMLSVEAAWWRRLAALSPAEAARLYVKAAAAVSLESQESSRLRSAMSKLRRMVGAVTVMEGDPPPLVRTLRSARQSRQAVIVSLEGHDRTIVTSDATFIVVEVYLDKSQWMVTLASPSGNRDLGIGEGEAITVPVQRLLGVVPSLTPMEDLDASPSTFDPRPIEDVVVEFASDRDWVVASLEPQEIDEVGPGRHRARITVWGIPNLKTLLLRLGPDAVVVEPESLSDLKHEAAAEILQLYS